MTSPVTQITRARAPRTARVRQGRGFSPLPVLPTFCRVPDCRSPKRQPGFLVLPIHGGEAIPHALKSVLRHVVAPVLVMQP